MLSPEVGFGKRALASISASAEDIGKAVQRYHLIGTLGWQDVATRYRRSRIGAFWLTINIAVMIAALGAVFGTLFSQPLGQFLPFLAVGLILWGFISANINEGCTSLSDASGIILQVKMPIWVHIARVMWKNIIIFGHNLIIIPLLFFLFLRPVSMVAFLAVPGFALLVVNLLWIMMIAAVICARFRDVTQIVTNAVQVSFYVTPLLWNADMIEHRFGKELLYINPFYSLITIVRAPLMGEFPSAANWLICVVMAITGWFVALWFYGSRLKRVPYWL